MSAREDLERIRTIIEEIEANGYAEMSVGGKRFKTHDLPTLYARERELMSRVDDEEGNSTTSYVSWERR